MADVSLGSIQSPLPPLGSYVLFPPSFSDVVSFNGATYLRTGAYVLSSSTALTGTVFETQDGATATGLTSFFSIAAGNRQSMNGDGFFAGGVSGSTIRLTQIVSGVQTEVASNIAVSTYTSISTGALFGFSVGSRRFVSVYDDGGFSGFFEFTGGAMVSRSTDFGTQLSNRPNSVAFDGNTALLYTSRNASVFYRTADGGTSWTTVTAPATNITRMHAKAGLFAAARASNGNVYTSPTGLAGSWTARTLPAATAVVRDVFFAPDGSLLAVGSTGGGNDVIYRSTNDGVSWSTILTRANISAFIYDPRTQRIILSVGESTGPLLFSENNGVSWVETPWDGANFNAVTYPFYPIVRLETVGYPGNNPTRLLRGIVGSRSNAVSVGQSNYYIRII